MVSTGIKVLANVYFPGAAKLSKTSRMVRVLSLASYMNTVVPGASRRSFERPMGFIDGLSTLGAVPGFGEPIAHVFEAAHMHLCCFLSGGLCLVHDSPLTLYTSARKSATSFSTLMKR